MSFVNDGYSSSIGHIDCSRCNCTILSFNFGDNLRSENISSFRSYLIVSFIYCDSCLKDGLLWNQQATPQSICEKCINLVTNSISINKPNNPIIKFTKVLLDNPCATCQSLSSSLFEIRLNNNLLSSFVSHNSNTIHSKQSEYPDCVPALKKCPSHSIHALPLTNAAGPPPRRRRQSCVSRLHSTSPNSDYLPVATILPPHNSPSPSHNNQITTSLHINPSIADVPPLHLTFALTTPAPSPTNISSTSETKSPTPLDRLHHAVSNALLSPLHPPLLLQQSPPISPAPPPSPLELSVTFQTTEKSKAIDNNSAPLTKSTAVPVIVERDAYQVVSCVSKSPCFEELAQTPSHCPHSSVNSDANRASPRFAAALLVSPDIYSPQTPFPPPITPVYHLNDDATDDTTRLATESHAEFTPLNIPVIPRTQSLISSVSTCQPPYSSHSPLYFPTAQITPLLFDSVSSASSSASPLLTYTDMEPGEMSSALQEGEITNKKSPCEFNLFTDDEEMVNENLDGKEMASRFMHMILYLLLGCGAIFTVFNVSAEVFLLCFSTSISSIKQNTFTLINNSFNWDNIKFNLNMPNIELIANYLASRHVVNCNALEEFLTSPYNFAHLLSVLLHDKLTNDIMQLPNILDGVYSSIEWTPLSLEEFLSDPQLDVLASYEEGCGLKPSSVPFSFCEIIENRYCYLAVNTEAAAKCIHDDDIDIPFAQVVTSGMSVCHPEPEDNLEIINAFWSQRW